MMLLPTVNVLYIQKNVTPTMFSSQFNENDDYFFIFSHNHAVQQAVLMLGEMLAFCSPSLKEVKSPTKSTLG